MKNLKSISENVVARIVFVLLVIGLQSCNDNIDPAASVSVGPVRSGVSVNSDVIRPRFDLLTTGLQGIVFNSSFQAIPGAVVTFSNAGGNYVAVCDANGSFKIALAAGSYYSSATASGYQSYFSSPGTSVVTGSNGFQTNNFFLSNTQVMGFRGGVYDASTFATIPNATVTYVKSNDPTLVFSTFTTSGYYSLDLPQMGGYYAKASAPGYTPYDSYPGLHVLNSSGFHTANFFLNP